MKTLKLITWCLLGGLLANLPAGAQRFFPDDPLEKEPPPLETVNPAPRGVSGLVDSFENLFGKPGERQSPNNMYPARGVNTLGEVMDGPWYTNRYARHRVTAAELICGPGCRTPPSRKQPWRVLSVKRWGSRPGILITDANNQRYLLRFDPPGHPEMATGAAMVSSRLFYALGYRTLENYIVYFKRTQLVASPESRGIGNSDRARGLLNKSIDFFLKQVPHDPVKGYRAVASRLPQGQALGPFQFYGTRSDDPNDIVPHEHRRDLRGLFVFASWVNHNSISPLATMDYLVRRNGVDYIRHHQTDFLATLGSGFEAEKSAWEGNELIFQLRASIKNLLGFGIYAPRWERTHYHRSKAVGVFGYQLFDPQKWTPDYELAAFANRLPGDTYWAAAKVMALTDDDIRAIVKTGRYSNQASEQWLAKCLIERRNRIGKTYLAKLLPLDHFRVEHGELKFEDLEVRYGFAGHRAYSVKWSEYRNQAGRHIPIAGATSLAVPAKARNGKIGSYFAATITAGIPGKNVVIYLRKLNTGFKVVGIDRRWPGDNRPPAVAGEK